MKFRIGIKISDFFYILILKYVWINKKEQNRNRVNYQSRFVEIKRREREDGRVVGWQGSWAAAYIYVVVWINGHVVHLTKLINSQWQVRIIHSISILYSSLSNYKHSFNRSQYKFTELWLKKKKLTNKLIIIINKLDCGMSRSETVILLLDSLAINTIY